MKLRKLTWRPVFFALFLLGAMQFIRPTMKDPPHQQLLAGAVVPGPVSNVFKRACQDCHSNNTHWPWYARVAPMSLFIAKDVENGRRFLNLSEWQSYSENRKLGYLSSMTEATRDRKMPPGYYSAMHSDARLSDSERKLIATWAHEERNRLRAARQHPGT